MAPVASFKDTVTVGFAGITYHVQAMTDRATTGELTVTFTVSCRFCKAGMTVYRADSPARYPYLGVA